MSESKLKNILYVLLAVIAVLVGGFLLFFYISNNSGYVNVKYRDDRVKISAPNFEPLNKSDTTVEQAWYDKNETYMIIDLNGTNYHYCEMPLSIWQKFKSSDSLDEFYQSEIKGNFDCRVYKVPEYNE